MTSRRQFIEVLPLVPFVPLVGSPLLAACSDKAAPPAPVAAPAPAPAAAPSPAPAPAAEAAAPAAAAPAVDEKDPQAVALGYAAEASKTDTKKFPKYTTGQNCANCALYQGKAGDAAGGCPLFGAKQVAAKGWCSAWAKKG